LKFVPERAANTKNGDQGPHGAIRYGLAAIKHVGEGAMELAIREREASGPFASLEDFCGRLGSRIANRKMLESLVKAGALDFVGRDRAELFACIDESLAAAASAHRDRAAGQVSLFSDEQTAETTVRRKTVIPWSEPEKLSYEKELLGFYVTGHPLDAFAGFLATRNYQTIASLSELADRAPFKLAGAIVQIEKKFTKREGKPFAVIWLEDLTGTLEVVLWNEVYNEVALTLALGRVAVLKGTIEKRDETVRATAQKLIMLTPEKAASAVAGTATQAADVLLHFSPGATSEELREVREILASSPGPRRVQLVFGRPGGDALRVDAGADFCVNLTRELEEKLARWLISAKRERNGVEAAVG
jgi:DNA polymerase-3 subunit alpha